MSDSKAPLMPLELQVTLSHARQSMLHAFTGYEDAIKAQIDAAFDRVISTFDFNKEIESILNRKLHELVSRSVEHAVQDEFRKRDIYEIAAKAAVSALRPSEAEGA